MNYIWASLSTKLIFLPVKKIWKFKLKKSQQYIFCANHFSYLDIPILCFTPVSVKFVGKNSLSKIPIFGFMYKRFHITVDRSSYRSRVQSLKKAKEELKNGFNLVFFPEGGIRLKEYPYMAHFKDGAFSLSVEKNIPIIPVSLLDNYFILKGDNFFDIRRKKCRIVYHKPIWPDLASNDPAKQLKEKVFHAIHTELVNAKNQANK